ncbi:putative membrane protein [Halogranum amylolyticum]|uniref:Putative membrane protein n=1 Tax=Halogranum amylolyticum TaxID=660520 RepID=A0A1H8WVY6_9EURY|nr:SHOCT domain-containing protein [Halogranum amylolyticum]SEP31870.1 putative membrane protein [Halogranum amylolyticum]
MTQLTAPIGRLARRLTLLAVPLLVATTGTAVAMGGGYGGGMMGGGGGLFGGVMGLWGLLWMGLLLAIPLYLVFALARRRDDRTNERPLSVLRERYARGELSADEFERRREQLERAG